MMSSFKLSLVFSLLQIKDLKSETTKILIYNIYVLLILQNLHYITISLYWLWNYCKALIIGMKQFIFG